MPVVGAPPPFVERRQSHRRASDVAAHRETVLLARALDRLVRDEPGEVRLARVLELLAQTAGAQRAALVTGSGDERRVAVLAWDDEDEAAPTALATWLDAWAPRSRAERAASPRASVLIVRLPAPEGGRATPTAESHATEFACLPIPSSGDVALGFAFPTEAAAAGLDERLSPDLARHAAVVLAVTTAQVAADRELASLRTAEEERGRFVATVAHELRTPLTGLAGYLELMLNGQVADPADERDFLERARQIVSGMTELVGDLLELSRLDSGALPIDPMPFSPAEVVARVAESLAPIALDREVHVQTSVPPRLRTASGDRRRVEQIVTNLAGNALKFAPRGSTVEIVAWFEESVALVAIRDEGRGISAEDRTRIFERFYRMAAHERVTGTGLGLPIARELARSMGGDLDVASVPGSGSAFVLAVPGATRPARERVAGVLDRVLIAEEVRLEERAVLQALAVARRPRLVRSYADRGGLDEPGEPGESAPGVPRVHDRPRPALRAIDGRTTRDTDPAPA